MRPTISGLVAAFAVMTVAAAPAMACGGYGPCAQSYVPTPVYSGCYSGCSWRERLPDPVQQYGYPAPQHLQQYYYVNQGPTYRWIKDNAPVRIRRAGVCFLGRSAHQPEPGGPDIERQHRGV